MKKIAVFIAISFIILSCATQKQYPPGLDGRINMIIKKGSNINAKDKDGLTLLIRAAKSNNAAAITKILKNGGDVSIRDNNGKNATETAFYSDSFDAFKILLEKGGKANLDILRKTCAKDKSKKPFFELYDEFMLYQKAMAPENSRHALKAIDKYFSICGKYYTKEMEKKLDAIIKKDYLVAKKSKNKNIMENFIKKYSRIGQKGYVITAGSLRIRTGPSKERKNIGRYLKGEKIYAIKIKNGWIKTDKGWISGIYAKKTDCKIPAIQKTYIYNIKKELAKFLAKFKDKKSKTDKKPARNLPLKKAMPPASGPQKYSKVKRAEQEFEILMEAPTKEALEVFILQYKDDASCRYLVDKAKEKYKAILLGQ